jgi:hypothetical protein
MDSIPKLSILIPKEDEREPFKLDKGEDVESNPPTPVRRLVRIVVVVEKGWVAVNL